MNNRYILSVVTRNSPGVLSRISGLLRRKMFNIDSLTVGRSPHPNESRFTIVIEGDETQAHKAAKLIDRLIEVRSVKLLDPHTALRREIVMARIKVNGEAQAALLRHAENEVLSKELSNKDQVITVELIDTSQKLDAFLEKIQSANLEILDWVRSGVIALEG